MKTNLFFLKLVHRRQFLVLCSTILQTYGALWDNSRKIWKMQSAQSIKQKHSSETRMKEDRRWPLSNEFFSKIEWVHQRIVLVWKIAVIHLSLNIKFPRLFSQFWFTFIQSSRKLWFHTAGFYYPKRTFECDPMI